MKNHEQIDAENGTEKESNKIKKTGNISQNGMRGGRAECLHPAQHPLQHLTLKLLRTLRKGKVPAANKKKGKCGEGA